MRYAQLQLSELDLYEYTFMINSGSEFDDIMSGLVI